ncbi:uncharacterized protein MONOS_8786 [Monocercomonoides exilis]|uniref:uncharacterized protein n=1 Tax=Monocercomonoides exilis TaxID=2049356 RepID=UPI003559528D|nr:hypothetical protein MONOS_8786 [Monocercomonoides exilis]|eukprot:MONOS_8786.1-p1 / transcript=MONOS_8786.1 / gene=MONOS_8786 / organism=Monocercomonoides_exilis_PA203 / gene_product=unspecified product / transcript_product=unspecified product / location=Mono_scaffold00341:34942-35650(+) / protein_length=141 / sequence_SO=supercontig / SO=protein_coding / is_pseudo=false
MNDERGAGIRACNREGGAEQINPRAKGAARGGKKGEEEERKISQLREKHKAEAKDPQKQPVVMKEKVKLIVERIEMKKILNQQGEAVNWDTKRPDPREKGVVVKVGSGVSVVGEANGSGGGECRSGERDLLSARDQRRTA